MGGSLPGLRPHHIMICLLSLKKQTRSKTNKEKITFFFFYFSFCFPYFCYPFNYLCKTFLNQLIMKEQGLMTKFLPQWGYVVLFHFANTALRIYSIALSIIWGKGSGVVP